MKKQLLIVALIATILIGVSGGRGSKDFYFSSLKADEFTYLECIDQKTDALQGFLYIEEIPDSLLKFRVYSMYTSKRSLSLPDRFEDIKNLSVKEEDGSFTQIIRSPGGYWVFVMFRVLSTECPDFDQIKNDSKFLTALKKAGYKRKTP